MARIETIGKAMLYLGDCREILPTLPKVNTVVTDPPYPDYHAEIYRAADFDPPLLDKAGDHQFVFWSNKADFPLDYTAIHIWDKTGTDIASYERIFERRGQKHFFVWKGNPITNPTMARFAKDEWCNHPSQKPVSLIKKIVARTLGAVIDPYMGSGTTGVACTMLDREFIGIEIEEKYFDIACRRIDAASRQGDMFSLATA